MKTSGQPYTPPRLLLGVVLLFWGAVTEQPLVGLLCAIVVEARWWTNLRWDFTERGFVRAWNLSFLIGVLAALWFWLQGSSVYHLFDLLVWIPVFFLPVALAQAYATRPTMPLNTFSFIARRKMNIDRAAGRTVDPIQVHMGYPYLALVLLASSLNKIHPVAFFLGLVVIGALAFFFLSPRGARRPVGWMISILLVAALGSGVSLALAAAYEYVQGFSPRGSAITSAHRSQTAIGEVGNLKFSRKIFWRFEDESAGGGQLYREAVFNQYSLGRWWHKTVDINDDGERAEDETGKGKKDTEVLKGERDFEEMWDREMAAGEKEFVFLKEHLQRDPSSLRKLSLIGSVGTKTPLPLPSNVQQIANVRVTDGGVDFNSLGTVRLVNPDHSVVRVQVYYGGEALHEFPPDPLLDMQIPRDELDPKGEADRRREKGEGEGRGRKKESEKRIEYPGIVGLCDAWGLRGMDAREAMAEIERRFVDEFTYTQYQDYGHHTGPRQISAVSRFLSRIKQGHCEYFATAAVLLLREAGIPARYCVGFAAHERDKDGTWLLRGVHAHSWCRVWVEGEEFEVFDEKRGETRKVKGGPAGYWVNFDPTPPDWLTVDGAVGSDWQRQVLDWWQATREEFLVWRTSSQNSATVNWIIGLVSLLLAVYVTLRLWMSRKRSGDDRRRSKLAGREVRRTPLHALSKLAERWLGRCPEGVSFTEWISRLAEHHPSLEPSLNRAVSYHWKARFDPLGLEPAEEGAFESLCADLRNKLKALRKERS